MSCGSDRMCTFSHLSLTADVFTWNNKVLWSSHKNSQVYLEFKNIFIMLWSISCIYLAEFLFCGLATVLFRNILCMWVFAHMWAGVGVVKYEGRFPRFVICLRISRKMLEIMKISCKRITHNTIHYECNNNGNLSLAENYSSPVLAIYKYLCQLTHLQYSLMHW